MRRAVPLSLGASQLVGSIILWPQLQLLPPGSCSSSHPDFLSWCVVSRLRQRFEQPCSWWFSHLATGGCLQLYFSLESCTTTEEGSKLHKLLHNLYRADAWVMCFYNSHRKTRWNLGKLNSIPNCLEIILIIIMVWIWVCSVVVCVLYVGHGVHASWCAYRIVGICDGVHVSWCACEMVSMFHSVHVSLCAYVMVSMCYGMHVSCYAC